MANELDVPAVSDLPQLLTTLAEWQQDGTAVQLHPGDLGWAAPWGPEPVAARLRVWSRAGGPAAMGFIDGSVLRLAMSPDVDDDQRLAGSIVADLVDSPMISAVGRVEVRGSSVLRERLTDAGWADDELWVSLRRDLELPIATPGVTVVAIDPDRAEDFCTVHRSAFGSDRLVAVALQTMMAAPLFRQARALVAYSADSAPAACAIGWSAGPARPSLIEPMGVHAEFRGQGFGTAITKAAAAALRDLGSSYATVATPASQSRVVATYQAAGLVAGPVIPDLRRPGTSLDSRA